MVSPCPFCDDTTKNQTLKNRNFFKNEKFSSNLLQNCRGCIIVLSRNYDRISHRFKKPSVRSEEVTVGKNVVALMLQEYENFTKSEKKIVDYVLEHQKETQYISITAVSYTHLSVRRWRSGWASPTTTRNWSSRYPWRRDLIPNLWKKKGNLPEIPAVWPGFLIRGPVRRG